MENTLDERKCITVDEETEEDRTTFSLTYVRLNMLKRDVLRHAVTRCYKYVHSTHTHCLTRH
jgi:hypothetical protein